MRNESKEIPYAGFWVRLAAYAMDMFFVSLLLLAVRIPHFFAGTGSLLNRPVFFTKTAYDILLYVLQSLYFIVLTRLRGATLGKSLFRLKVISAEDRKLTWIEVIFRETVGRFLSTVILLIGYILIIPDDEKRALHDMLSDTRVIYAHEEDAYRKRRVPVPAGTGPVFENFAPAPVSGERIPAEGNGNTSRQMEENNEL